MTPPADTVDASRSAADPTGASGSDPERGAARTVVGTRHSAVVASVDPSGGVMAGSARPVIDWAVGAEDRWHDPRTSKAVRQRLIGNAPVVETAMHVPGGDILHRVFAVPAADGTGRSTGGESSVVVIEVENRSAIPVAVAITVRPGAEGLSRLAFRSGSDEGSGPWAEVVADGVAALRLNRLPHHVRLTTAAGHEPDAFVTVTAGPADAPNGHDTVEVVCAAGAANGAFVFPLAHTAVLRAIVPIGARPSPRRTRLGLGRGRTAAAPTGAVVAWPEPIASAEQVARGWSVHAEKGAQLVVPAGRWPDELARAHRALLLWSASGTASVPPWGEIGLEEIAVMAIALDELAHHDEAAGLVREIFDRQALDGSFGSGSGRTVATALAMVAAGTHAALAPVPHAEHLDALVGPVAKAGHWLHRRASRGADEVGLVALGLRRGASLLRRAVQADAAEQLDGFARARLVERAPLVPDDRAPLVAASVAWRASVAVVDRIAAGAAVGGSPALAAALVAHHARHALVREGEVDGELSLVPELPAPWLGQAIEVHRVPTTAGLLSFAVRWHGDRPALLWDLEAGSVDGPAPPAVVLSSPGLDPTWSSTSAQGEALLAALAAASPPGSGGSFT